jgi:hypothetical protein
LIVKPTGENMPINVMIKKEAFQRACKKAKKLSIENNRDYVVYYSDEYGKYQVIANEDLMRYDNGMPFEEILYFAEAW